MNKSNKSPDKSNVKNPSGRVQYGFELNFPARFTLKALYEARHGKIKYITLYSRVKNALAEGVIVKDGEHTPKVKTRGRRQIVFRRVDAKKATVKVTKAPAPIAPDVVAAPADAVAAV